MRGKILVAQEVAKQQKRHRSGIQHLPQNDAVQAVDAAGQVQEPGQKAVGPQQQHQPCAQRDRGDQHRQDEQDLPDSFPGDGGPAYRDRHEKRQQHGKHSRQAGGQEGAAKRLLEGDGRKHLNGTLPRDGGKHADHRPDHKAGEKEQQQQNRASDENRLFLHRGHSFPAIPANRWRSPRRRSRFWPTKRST